MIVYIYFCPSVVCVVLWRMFRFCVFLICISKSSLNISQSTPTVNIFRGTDNFDNVGLFQCDDLNCQRTKKPGEEEKYFLFS